MLNQYLGIGGRLQHNFANFNFDFVSKDEFEKYIYIYIHVYIYIGFKIFVFKILPMKIILCIRQEFFIRKNKILKLELYFFQCIKNIKTTGFSI